MTTVAILQARMTSSRLPGKVVAPVLGMPMILRQLERLEGMLGHDIAEIYSETGALRAVADWPEVWRRQLRTEIESKDLNAYSKDGQQAGDRAGEDRLDVNHRRGGRRRGGRD